jgi:hypothetical protein
MQIRGYSVDDHFIYVKNVATAPISRSPDPPLRPFPDLQSASGDHGRNSQATAAKVSNAGSKPD